MSGEREAVVAAGKKLLAEGLIARTWGNVSSRRGNRMWITPSGRSYEGLRSDEIVPMEIAAGDDSGGMNPSSEWRVHRAIYRERRDISFIIHTHQKEASVFSTLGLELPLGQGRAVPVAAYGFPGSADLEAAVAAVLGSADGVLMANHGILAFGKDGESAFAFAREMERLAALEIEKALGDKACDLYAFVLSAMTAIPLASVSSFADMTAAIRARRRDIVAVLPVRSEAVLAFSRLRRNLCPYLDDFAQIIGAEMSWAPQDPQAIAAAFGDRHGVFLAGAGALMGGATAADAQAAALIAEKNCRAFFAGRLFQGANPLGAKEAAALRRFYLDVYSRRY